MMKLVEILSQYPDAMLDRLATDKVDEVAGLRLPRPVVVQEVAQALSSMSYVARVLAPTRPPTYAMLRLLIEAPGHTLPGAEFREAVLAATDALTAQAADGRAFQGGRQIDLYLSILRTAWENDGEVDRSEALLLEALRKELGLWPREHFLLEHHPKVRALWEGPRAFDVARNHLLATGVLLTWDNAYILAEEVAGLVRDLWDITITDGAYLRLLDRLTVGQLRGALAVFDLPLSGMKSERAERLIRALVPPIAVLDTLHIDDVRALCRDLALPVSLNKSELMAQIIGYFDQQEDLVEVEVVEDVPDIAPEPEPRVLNDQALGVFLDRLTVDQLHDILREREMRLSGTKGERIARLVEGPWSERTMLATLAKTDLARLCRRVGVPVSGVKSELMDRLLEAHGSSAHATAEQTPPTSTPEPLVVGLAVDPCTDPTPVPGLRDIQVDFPDLDHSEQVVLALLERARSLSERELERAVHKHGLPWFLIKAHMADLIGRISAGRGPLVHVRSAGGHNIYEWGGDREPDRIERAAVRDVIDALRNGVVPERHLDLLAVGQEAARRHLVDLLDHVGTERSEFKFVRGPYGAGKTFITAWLREAAFNKGFAVSTVRVGPDQSLADLPVFYSGMVQGLRTPENREASALADILESWLLALHRRVAMLEGLDPADANRAALVALVEQAIETETARLGELDPSFAVALRQFYRSRLDDDLETMATVLSWLRGSRALSADALRRIGVRGALEPECVFGWMRALLHLVRGGRLHGLLLIVDELELVRRFPHARQRERAFETLRLLVDEAGENGLPGCLMLFTGTDALFEDRQYGLRSYEALANRIETPPSPTGRTSVRQPIVDLAPLDAHLLLAVAQRVRDIHAVAYGWDSGGRVTDGALEAMITQATAFGDGQMGRLPRPFLRELVHVLDLCEENPGILASDCLRSGAEPPVVAAAVLGLLDDTP